MYELAGEAFLDAAAVGLLPFTALMTPRAWVEKCIETTRSADVDSETRATEAIMQESPFYEYVLERGKAQGMERGRAQGIEQGIEQGIVQGARQTSIESTLAILNERFPTADVSAVRSVLEAMGDLERLKRLNFQASIATSFKAFQEHLDA